jgi:hypothetical protein
MSKKMMTSLLVIVSLCIFDVSAMGAQKNKKRADAPCDNCVVVVRPFCRCSWCGNTIKDTDKINTLCSKHVYHDYCVNDTCPLCSPECVIQGSVEQERANLCVKRHCEEAGSGIDSVFTCSCGKQINDDFLCGVLCDGYCPACNAELTDPELTRLVQRGMDKLVERLLKNKEISSLYADSALIVAASMGNGCIASVIIKNSDVSFSGIQKALEIAATKGDQKFIHLLIMCEKVVDHVFLLLEYANRHNLRDMIEYLQMLTNISAEDNDNKIAALPHFE